MDEATIKRIIESQGYTYELRERVSKRGDGTMLSYVMAWTRDRKTGRSLGPLEVVALLSEAELAAKIAQKFDAPTAKRYVWTAISQVKPGDIVEIGGLPRAIVSIEEHEGRYRVVTARRGVPKTSTYRRTEMLSVKVAKPVKAAVNG